jgi:hypothetical protein
LKKFTTLIITRYEDNSTTVVLEKLRKQSLHWLLYVAKITQTYWFLKNLETITILAFVACESNLITLVSITLETISTLAFVRCESNSNAFVYEKDLSQPFKAMRYVLCHVSWPNTRTIATCRPLAQFFLQSRRS